MLASSSGTAQDAQVDRGSTARPDVGGVSTLPAAPASLEETGLSPKFLMELVLKMLHYAETARADHISRRLGLSPRLVDELLAALKEGQLCESLGSPSSLTGGYRYTLTNKGQ